MEITPDYAFAAVQKANPQLFEINTANCTALRQNCLYTEKLLILQTQKTLNLAIDIWLVLEYNIFGL